MLSQAKQRFILFKRRFTLQFMSGIPSRCVLIPTLVAYKGHHNQTGNTHWEFSLQFGHSHFSVAWYYMPPRDIDDE